MLTNIVISHTTTTIHRISMVQTTLDQFGTFHSSHWYWSIGLDVAPLYSWITVATVLFLLCLRGWYYRYQQRIQVMRFIYTSTRDSQQQQPAEQEMDDIAGSKPMQYSLRHCHLRMCVLLITQVELTTRFKQNNHRYQETFVVSLWNCLQCLCCSSILRCWCQCCGMCAIGQDDRELSRLDDDSNYTIQWTMLRLNPFTTML